MTISQRFVNPVITLFQCKTGHFSVVWVQDALAIIVDCKGVYIVDYQLWYTKFDLARKDALTTLFLLTASPL